jgi:hypothetical protein
VPDAQPTTEIPPREAPNGGIAGAALAEPAAFDWTPSGAAPVEGPPLGRAPVDRAPVERLPLERESGERHARRELRGQIARLERELANTFVSAFPRSALDVSVPASGGPRLLSLGELESLRDALASRLTQARRELARRGEEEERNRILLERMLLEPGRYKFVRIPCADLGEGGCGEWQVRPRFGLIGMLAGGWQVKLSSGCPFAGGLPAPGSPAR